MKSDNSLPQDGLISFADSEVHVATETIVLIDIVQATATSDLYGWYAVGRRIVWELRQKILEIGKKYTLKCIKSTGDGFLLTYADSEAAEKSTISAIKASLELLESLDNRNLKIAEELQIDIRVAIHFGEVDVLEQDREGPNISYTFRIEGINGQSLTEAISPIDPSEFPLKNYILCSERVSDICHRRKTAWDFKSCGLFKLKGFSGLWEIFLVEIDNISKGVYNKDAIDMGKGKIIDLNEEVTQLKEELKKAKEIIGEFICPHCGALLEERSWHTIYGEYNGKEMEADVEVITYECGLTLRDGDEISGCQNC